MTEHSELKIFHYHFLTGGVSTVVRQAIAALRAHLPAIRSIELVAGRIPREFRSQVDQYSVKYSPVPEIAYRQPTKEDHDKNSVAREAGKLAEELLRAFGSYDSIWWVHNYHLGKNVVFTQALLEIIHSNRAQRIILQIHDFPECGRFANLKALKDYLSLDPYPVSPWVRYAVLNRRDRDVLLSAGVPARAVFLLENPVALGPAPVRPKSIGPTLKRLFGESFPQYDARAPVLLYPVRTIRRKNALEALLLGLLLDRTANILITLPGVSSAERRYSDLVERLFSDGLCPGLWGFGSALERQGIRFEDLAAGSDLVLSTSVQEGFGYLFINALLWALPLAARDLDTLGGLKDLFEEYPASFYDAILVPIPEEAALPEAYRSKIRGLSELIPKAEQDRLLASADTLVRDGLVDFSFLPVEAQANLLREIAAGSAAALRLSRMENTAVLSKIEDLLANRPIPATRPGNTIAEAVNSRFGPAAYAREFRRIIGTFGQKPDEDSRIMRPSIGAEVLRAFLKLENLRLLYDY